MSLTSYRAAPPRAIRVTILSSRLRQIPRGFVTVASPLCGDAFCLSNLVQQVVSCFILLCKRSVRKAKGPRLAALLFRLGPLFVERRLFFLLRLADLAATDSPASCDAVPWALRGFTAEFGMGSGAGALAMATRSTKPTRSYEMNAAAGRGCVQGDCRCARWEALPVKAVPPTEIKPIERLVPVSSTHCCAYTPGLSTWSSATALIGNTGFEGGFPLRCFQRLSRPHIATRRCDWRHNRCTRGASIPVLSY